MLGACDIGCVGLTGVTDGAGFLGGNVDGISDSLGFLVTGADGTGVPAGNLSGIEPEVGSCFAGKRTGSISGTPGCNGIGNLVSAGTVGIAGINGDTGVPDEIGFLPGAGCSTGFIGIT